MLVQLSVGGWRLARVEQVAGVGYIGVSSYRVRDRSWNTPALLQQQQHGRKDGRCWTLSLFPAFTWLSSFSRPAAARMCRGSRRFVAGIHPPCRAAAQSWATRCRVWREGCRGMVPPAWGSSPSPSAGETEREMEGGGDRVLAALPASSTQIPPP